LDQEVNPAVLPYAIFNKSKYAENVIGDPQIF